MDTLKTPINMLADYFGIEEYSSSLTSHYNIAPTQEVAAGVRTVHEQKEEEEAKKLSANLDRFFDEMKQETD